ncbi:error-prone DNA polymerase [Mucilaginibacter ginsenosidivorans]|uniref:Error-prone DNA polymerase n=1 Tax=Mucilaginibacter ginsenosidivorans TaxID=398053 RepID=A0A5B8USE4_9SPHI|nr:error-prone DNA polymerase [Mucilaginibacter ginsenosidivorans]QEC61954.1 DNA polymerase III subunit alpha [Mucilaginibacter ginsenosidivorans]
MEYSELQVTTNFSFLRGGSHPRELVACAAAYGHTKIAITDRNSVAGVVRAHLAAKEAGIPIIPGCRFDLLDGPSLLAYPTDQDAWTRMCALITLGNLRTEKGQCDLYKKDVYDHAQGILFALIPPDTLNKAFEFDASFIANAYEYREALGSNLYVCANRTYRANDAKRLYRIAGLDIPMLATNDVHYHHSERRPLQDVLMCIREKCNIYNAGYKLHQNAERHLKSTAEMERLFRGYPDAIRRTQEISEACTFSLDTLKYIEPENISTDGLTAQERLTKLTIEGAHKRYGDVIPEKVKTQIAFELDFIERRKLAPYFLRVHKYTSKAAELEILYQGRGSAANSTVCFCLAITPVDPMKSRLVFSRFMSDAREEWPDIDVDFEHERREEIIQFIYEDYGREHAAIVATVTQERYKGAVRDVGKAMGLSEDTIKRLSGSVWHYHEDGVDLQFLSEQGLNPDDPHLRKVVELTDQLMGFPRQLGQHTGGFVITHGKLSDICPVLNARMENRVQLEWNKDDLEALGILKVDVLGLGMLTCIRKGFDLIKQHYGPKVTLANIPQDDAEVYDMFCHADTVGVFQIESRAQMSMLPRLQPRCFYDLVIEVAIVRPGPIQGQMVHPYLKRRQGLIPVEYPSPELEEILGRTLGVPLFQEQAMEIAIIAAGYTPAEADQLRRSIASFKANGQLHLQESKFVNGMVNNGYTPEFSEYTFKLLQGFQEGYGFPESHASAFAWLVYVSGWIKCHYPDVFCAALLNSQPMGFYQPAQIVTDAKKHGVIVRPIDINYSMWDNILEEQDGKYRALRLGFRQANGIRQDDMDILVSARTNPFKSIEELHDAGISIATLELLADADTFRSINLDRRQALWEVTALKDKPAGLFVNQPSESAYEGPIELPHMSAAEHVVQDYMAVGLSLKAHPVSFLRPRLDQLQVTPTAALSSFKNGDKIKVAGLVTVRQRPGTAKGVMFITIEDETGFANLVVWAKVFETYRKEILQGHLLMAEGILQIEGEVIHVVAKRCFDLSRLLQQLPKTGQEDESKSGKENKKAPPPNVQGDLFAVSRNFR